MFVLVYKNRESNSKLTSKCIMKWGIMLITRCFDIQFSETSISKAILQPCHLVLEDVHKRHSNVIKSLQIHTLAHTFFLLEFRSLNKML